MHQDHSSNNYCAQWMLHPQAFQGRVLMAAQTPAVQKMHQEPVKLYLFHYGGMHFSLLIFFLYLFFINSSEFAHKSCICVTRALTMSQ